MNYVLLVLVCVFVLAGPAWASPASEESAIGDSLVRNGSYSDAVLFYNKALKLNPDFEPAQYGKNYALRHMRGGGATKIGRTIGPDGHPVRKAYSAASSQPDAVIVDSAPSPVHAMRSHRSQKRIPHIATKERRPVHVAMQQQAVSQPTGANTETTVASAAAAATAPAPVQQAAETSSPAPAVSQPQTTANATAPGPQLLPEKKAPPWLIVLACCTFLSLVVLTVRWLSPTLSASKELQTKLKVLEKSREEQFE